MLDFDYIHFKIRGVGDKEAFASTYTLSVHHGEVKFSPYHLKQYFVCLVYWQLIYNPYKCRCQLSGTVSNRGQQVGTYTVQLLNLPKTVKCYLTNLFPSILCYPGTYA